MPQFQFEAMDSTGQEIKDVIDATTEAEAQATIRQMGYFVTKISVKKARKTAEKAKPGQKKKRPFVIGGVKSKVRTVFTRQLSILQDAGLPILRSLRILEAQSKPGRFKNSLMDVCDEIEGGATLSEAMAKSPKAFDRLYVNMIKAGEAGGALEVILRRLAEFQERSQSLKRKVKGAMVYPVVVVLVAVGILTFIMISIVPQFVKIFKDFDTKLPQMTVALIAISHAAVDYWWAIPLIPVSIHGCLHGQAAQIQLRPRRVGHVYLESSHLRPACREKHPGPHDAHLGHVGLQRRADSRSPEHHPRDGRQRRL